MRERAPDPTSFLPLPAPTFHILAALVEQDRHGYAIMQFIQEESGGSVRVGPGTLYPALRRLLASALIAETEERTTEEPGERRRYYSLTALGRSVAVAEAKRLEQAVRLASSLKLIRPRLS